MKFRNRPRWYWLPVLLWGLWLPLQAADQLTPAAAIASAHPLATAAGFEILSKGGNAFDAAVAVAAALAVVEPAGSGLGGGGFFLLHRAKDKYQVMIDARERAPLASHRDMYLDSSGKVIPRSSIDGPRAAAIPGVPAALVHLADSYGKLDLATSLAPAIGYARQGFVVGPLYRRQVQRRFQALQNDPAAARIFLQNGELPEPGFRLRQPDLAKVLESIARNGHAGFYQGWVAEKLAEGVRRAGGIWQRRDLSEYRVVERSPVRGRFRGIEVISAAPPSSGGIVLLETLNILAGYDANQLQGAAGKHLLVEAWRRAYRDRALYLGDPDYVPMPLARLLSPDYAAGLRVAIHPKRTLPSRWLNSSPDKPIEGAETTHFSILDRQGNRVAATLSINFLFGAAFVAPGTGVLLNDEMDDFSLKPGVPNLYGLVGGQANAIAPGKRMLSSMTPTFLESKTRSGIVGTPGGSRIISMVTLAVLEFARGMTPQFWVGWPRFHHQYLPDEIQYEPAGLTIPEIKELKQRGHVLHELPRSYGNMQAILWDRTHNEVYAASDPRGEGWAKVE